MYFENLLINMQNNNTPEPKLLYIELKQFYSAFGLLKSSMFITIVNTLSNNVFKYQIILSDKIVSPFTVSNFYVFNLLINLQYNDTKFKELFINSGASTWSIRGIGLLKTL